ncbi:hypothetical protein B0H99_107151 [Planomicrobium soli]|uniref:Uncharacterized protein n=1 Tax=Planomicrobium soli TaxID=1176648 RepID=A0A2P8GQT8_9BACL|nr:hypothetical protein B0H99_107151 [Planomicrobium soli]
MLRQTSSLPFFFVLGTEGCVYLSHCSNQEAVTLLHEKETSCSNFIAYATIT